MGDRGSAASVPGGHAVVCERIGDGAFAPVAYEVGQPFGAAIRCPPPGSALGPSPEEAKGHAVVCWGIGDGASAPVAYEVGQP